MSYAPQQPYQQPYQQQQLAQEQLQAQMMQAQSEVQPEEAPSMTIPPQVAAAAAAAAEAAASVAAAAAAAELANWSEQQDVQGRVFYHNSRTRMSTWVRPPGLQDKVRNSRSPKSLLIVFVCRSAAQAQEACARLMVSTMHTCPPLI